MRHNIVLIDLENVQPENLSAVAAEHFRLYAFVGANQSKLPKNTVISMQKLGSRAKYVEIAGSGPNALDFHIAYYVGELAAAEPEAMFHIVSNDKGFDPLIAHLKSRNMLVSRVKAIQDIRALTPVSLPAVKDRVATVIERLSSPKATKPRSVKTLSSHVANMYQKRLSQAEVEEIVAGLATAGFISIDGSKISYAPMSG